MRELTEEDVAAVGFRFAALRTQKEQDRHLATYETYGRVFFRVSATGEAAEREYFPSDHKKLFTRLRTFLAFIIKKATP